VAFAFFHWHFGFANWKIQKTGPGAFLARLFGFFHSKNRKTIGGGEKAVKKLPRASSNGHGAISENAGQTVAIYRKSS